MTSKQVKTYKFYVLLMLLALSVSNFSVAQVVLVEVEIEPELKTTIVNNLEFPDLVSNSGDFAIDLGDPNVGIFAVTGFQRQNVFLQLNTPLVLLNELDGVSEIPIEITSYYNNRNENDYNNAKLILNNSTSFPILDPNIIESDSDFWITAYIYITARITVGQINSGNYTGSIDMLVSYE